MRLGGRLANPHRLYIFQLAPHGGIRPAPRRRSRLALSLSAMMLRHELPVHRKSTLYVRSAIGAFTRISKTTFKFKAMVPKFHYR